MPRKRIKDKRRAKELKHDQFWDLLLIGRPGKLASFDTEEEQEKAWFAYRNQFIDDELIRERPGWRTCAWWIYEAKEPGECDNDYQWERLLELGELREWELPLVLKVWVHNLDLYNHSIAWNYENLKKGIKPGHYHSYRDMTWEQTCKLFDRQADKLGAEAREAWTYLKHKIINSWDEIGCGDCKGSISDNSCKQIACKQRRSKP